MKFNSQICTSREQSERLLALGLKKETADMHWRLQPYYNDEGFDCGLEWSCNIGTFLQEDAYELFFDYIPAWSLHRLIEMMPYCIVGQGWLSVGHQGLHYSRGYGVADNGLYESIIRMYAWLIKEGYFNKEYLEE